MSFIRWLRGSVRMEIQGAAPTAFLNSCAERDIPFRAVKAVDACTLRCTVNKADFSAARSLAEKSMCSTEILSEAGLPRLLRGLKKRYGLLLGGLLCCGMLLWSSLYVWEMDVSGNSRASETEIMSALENAGVGIGSFWPAFANEDIKCRVLCEVPELSWLAVNIRGSRATVSVRERVAVPTLYTEDVPTRIYAAKAGLVTEVQCLNGTALVKKGQTVLAGDTLISETVESSFEKAQPREVHAKGKITARTWYSLCAAAPTEQETKVYTGKTRSGFALQFGKKRINLFNLADNSRNCDTKYDKITNEYRLAVPNLFSTPVAFIRERAREYRTERIPADESALYAQLESELVDRLARAVGADGSILAKSLSSEKRGGVLYVTLRAECLENISREQTANENGEGETSQSYGQDHDH